MPPTTALAPRSQCWTVHDFRFDSGEVSDALSLHYLLLGDPDAPATLVLHGTGGSAQSLMGKRFGGELFGEGGPLDLRDRLIIVPDSVGHGLSSKPSDGLRMQFPRYAYSDMVRLQHRLVTEALGISHLDLVLGVSMGGMHAWQWATDYPDFADDIVSLAAQPSAMSGRNWMMRKLLVESIRQDPAWQGGDYPSPPPAMRLAALMFNVATNGGAQGLQRAAPTRDAADQWLATRLEQPPAADANDLIRQWEASRDYDPSGKLDRIRARVLSIVSEDDERILVPQLRQMIARLPRARLHVIPEGPETVGHSTIADARLWSGILREFLATRVR